MMLLSVVPLSRRGQVFTIDLILGLLITIAALFTLTMYMPTKDAPMRADVERLSPLMTSGLPAEWNATNVQMVGFLSNDRWNETKIATFANMSLSNQKRSLGVASDFTIRFYQGKTNLSLCAACGATPSKPADTLPVRRYALLNSTITMMEVRLYR